MNKKAIRRLQVVESIMPVLAIGLIVGFICLAVYDYMSLGSISDSLYLD